MSKIKISDMIISGKNVSIKIADKILNYHIRPMEEVQKIHNGKITCSENSGYRSQRYELSKGRSGTGQHTYVGKGATDWTTTGDLNELLDDMIKKTDYTRLTIYIESKFIHADYKKVDGYVHLYKSTKIIDADKKIKWEWIKYDKKKLRPHPGI